MKYILHQRRLTIMALVLICISCIHIHKESEYVADLLPNATEYSVDDESVTFRDLHLGDAENLILNGVSYFYGKVQEQPVRLVETDENYSKIHALQMQSGEFYNNDFEDVCVISSDLALKLFAQIDVVQNIIQIDEKFYTIVGVYGSDNSFLSLISSDGMDEIFIPAHLSTVVEKIYISDNGRYPAISDVHELFLSTRVSLSENDSINWFEKSDLLLQFEEISLFLAGITLSISLAFRAIIRIKKLILKNYLADKESMFAEENSKIKLFVQAGVLFGIAITLCIIIPFRFTLPFEWIPGDGNILNVLHYKELLIDAFQMRNSVIISYYGNIFWYVLWMMSLMILLLIIECILLLVIIIKNVSYKDDEK